MARTPYAWDGGRALYRQPGNIAVSVNLDLRPLANALRDLPREALGNSVHRALNRGIDRFKSAAHLVLKGYTKVRRPTRLKKGVRIFYARPGRLQADYVIRDKNIVVTRAMFGAKSGTSPRLAALARWGRAARAPTSWTSWDGARTRYAVFMFPGRMPVFIRMKRGRGGGGEASVLPVSGPNPAEIVRLHSGHFGMVLRQSAQAELGRQIELAYKQGVRIVKARYGL